MTPEIKEQEKGQREPFHGVKLAEAGKKYAVFIMTSGLLAYGKKCP
jgi:hypothetical protein